MNKSNQRKISVYKNIFLRPGEMGPSDTPDSNRDLMGEILRFPLKTIIPKKKYSTSEKKSPQTQNPNEKKW